MTALREQVFGKMADGAEAMLYTLETDGGLRVSITNYGGTITSLWTPDRAGMLSEVVLSYESLERYLAGKSYFGGIIGRYGNRIARARFVLDGISYSLPANDGPNHLHGGSRGFDKVLWNAEPVRSAEGLGLKLTRVSPDGEAGYPGTLCVAVTYSLPAADTLRIDYRATTDKPTPVNLTNHSYFNLAGHDAGDICAHELTVFASHFTPIDATLIPTGELRAVADTPFDFREPRRICERIDSHDEQLQFAGGYDHSFVLDRKGAGLERAAQVYEPRSGRNLEVLTTEPGIQFYSGNFLRGHDIGKGGTAYQRRAGFCLETQHFPDSPNQRAFPSTVLRPGEVLESTTLYRFSAR